VLFRSNHNKLICIVTMLWSQIYKDGNDNFVSG